MLAGHPAQPEAPRAAVVLARHPAQPEAPRAAVVLARHPARPEARRAEGKEIVNLRLPPAGDTSARCNGATRHSPLANSMIVVDWMHIAHSINHDHGKRVRNSAPGLVISGSIDLIDGSA
jgi:hypothetical protein